MSNYLFLLSISPVQEFITQARKTKDLYAGSRLLSDLIKVIITELKKTNDFELIFPNLESDSFPNRFVCKLKVKSEEEIKKIGLEAEKVFKLHLNTIIENICKELYIPNPKANILNQFLEFFSINWCSVEIKSDYLTAYRELEKLHAGIKNVRSFKQLGNGAGEQGRKCSICGERNAYFYKKGRRNSLYYISNNAVEINSLQLDDNEALCLVDLIKRFYDSKHNSFPSTVEIAIHDQINSADKKLLNSKNISIQLLYKDESDKRDFSWSEGVANEQELRELINSVLERNNLKSNNLSRYYSTIIFDGDKMGNLLSGANLKDPSKLEDFHKALTLTLSANAKKAKAIVDAHGASVYAGGDDFLGFCPISKLFSILRQLDESFKSEVQAKIAHYLINPQEVTISAGVVIAHFKTPLQSVLKMAREMESVAKNKADRNAVALAVNNHSGNVLRTFWKWTDDYDNINNINYIIDALQNRDFSTNFIYKIIEEFQALDFAKNESYDRQLATELKRLMQNSITVAKTEIETPAEFKLRKVNLIDELLAKTQKLYYETEDNNKKQFFDLLKIIAFFAKELGGMR